MTFVVSIPNPGKFGAVAEGVRASVSPLGVLLYQSLKMIENKDPPRENPSPKRKAFPSNMPRPCRMRGLQLVDRWISRPRKPFAGLPKCPRGAGQKEVSCAARALLYGSLRMAADSWGVMGMLWGHFGMCARVLRAARSWPAPAAPRNSPVFAGSRSSSMSGPAASAMAAS